MYEWLDDACADKNGHVVTANRRLARALIAEYGRQQLSADRVAWRSPSVYAWRDWLLRLFESGSIADNRIRINAQECRIIWEDCVRAEIDDPFVNISGLAKQCRDAWSRINEWMMPLELCQDSVIGQDQRMFARTAARYRDTLDQRGWLDEAMLPAWLIERVSDIEAPSRVSLAGFDRVSPAVETLLAALESRGCQQQTIRYDRTGASKLLRFENSAAELRAAGHWARNLLNDNSKLQVAIVVSKLEQSADYASSLLREGFVPGWQYSPDAAAAVNVSYGRTLSEYPAVHAALLSLRWLYQDLHGQDVGQLLRSPFIGQSFAAGRSRVELKLREKPDRPWSRQRFLQAFGDAVVSLDMEDWFGRWTQVGTIIADAPARMRPSEWAEHLDSVLRALNWPGEGVLSSTDFQLDNRWRELLNEFARLELVVPSLAGAEAVARLASMAGDTVFQAETDGPALAVMGPLEAAGQEFDRIWVTGLTAADWPPQSSPSALISRELQRDRGMPDASPDDTAEYAQRVLARLRASTPKCVLSFPRMLEDAEQLPTALLADLDVGIGDADPGWHAWSLTRAATLVEAPDPVPTVISEERVSGGAGTLQRQISEPFSAFAYGRLGVRWMPTFVTGIPASLRGSLLHDALFRLYQDKPSSELIKRWSESELEEKIRRAVAASFAPHERFADSVLRVLFAAERERTTTLLRDVVDVDRARQAFQIDSVEGEIAASFGELRLLLRHDRIEQGNDGELVVLDYKTGTAKKFLSRGEPTDFQLVVYACVLQRSIAGLGLFNVDSKHTGIDGAGPALVDTDDWQDTLDDWKAIVLHAADEIVKGDVRLNPARALKDARPLNLLSRFSELRLER